MADTPEQIPAAPQELIVQDIQNTPIVPPVSQVLPPIEIPAGPVLGTPPSHHKIPLIWIVASVTLLLFCTVAYALGAKTDIFGSSTYKEPNFSSRILEKLSSIKSASYVSSISLDVVPREAGAVPFVSKSGINESANEYMNFIPPDAKGKITLSSASELKPDSLADWSINIDAEGGVSDMAYKINVDALKKGENYFVKINNFPALFFVDQLTAIKEKWIIIATKAPSVATTTTETPKTDEGKIQNNTNTDVQAAIEKNTELFEKNKQIIIEAMKKVTISADKNKLISFKKIPQAETVDNQKLMRYDLSIKKEKIWPFYMTIKEEFKKDPELIKKLDLVFDTLQNKENGDGEGKDEKNESEAKMKSYLESEEFLQIFDYFEKNNEITLWTDMDGMPVHIQNTSKFIPPDTVETLKNKQITLIYDLVISKINLPVIINEPEDALPWETIAQSFSPSQNKLDESGIIAGLSSINSVANSVSAIDGSFGKKAFGAGPCSPKEETLFADENIAQVLNELTNNTMSLATCASRGRPGKVGLWALSVPISSKEGHSYCIDSKSTSARVIPGNLKGFMCPKEETSTSIIPSTEISPVNTAIIE